MSSSTSNNGAISSDSDVRQRQSSENSNNNSNKNRNDILRNGAIIEMNGNGTTDDSSYLALDQLLASLALENDIMERHLSQINNNDTNCIKTKSNSHQTATSSNNNNVFSFDETSSQENNCYTIAENFHNTNHTDDENLNDVLANLIEFTENESLPQQHNNCYTNGFLTNGTSNYHQHHHSNTAHHMQQINHLNNNFNYSNQISCNDIASNHINNNYIMSNGHNGNTINTNHINHRYLNYHEQSNNAIKRLTSESENSSSISPSLSERSNGIVSWSDQVCFIILSVICSAISPVHFDFFSLFVLFIHFLCFFLCFSFVRNYIYFFHAKSK